MPRFFPLVVALALVQPVAADSPKTPPFQAVVEANFAKWDKNHDGKLTALEVDAVVKDHSLTGPPAAAVAAIHVFFRKKGAPESIAKADLLKDHPNTDGGRRDQNGGAANIPGTYHGFNSHLSTVPRQIFAKTESPRVAGMTQGQVGDCFLIASVGAAANRNPEFVRKLVHEHADGSCEVTFPGAKTIKVPKLTDAEICLGSSAGDQGLWLNVFEKALGELTSATAKGPKNPKDIDLDTINRGGDPADVMRFLTAHHIVTVPLKRAKKPHTDAELTALQGQLHKILQAATNEKVLLCCGTSTGPLPHGVITDHAYAIVGYDSSTQLIHVWNPWGANYNVKLKPGEKPGLDHGYEVTKGHFSIPLHDFVRVFSDFHYETHAVTPKGK